METIASLFHAVTRALRGAFDLGAMAFGVAPTGISLGDAVALPNDGRELAGRGNALFERDGGSTALHTASSPFGINPVTGLLMPCGEGGLDLAGNPYGCGGDDHG